MADEPKKSGGASELMMRAKIHPEETAAEVKAALEAHVFLEDVARSFGVSIPTITRIAKLLGLEGFLPRGGTGTRGRPRGLKWRKTLTAPEVKKR